MGVTGLWGVVDSVGHPINLETLHNKVIAIDLSLWVNQSIKGFRGPNGQTVDNAHVLGLFHRICKLLFYKIKPVFVFDGNCPQLKRKTIAKRQEQRRKAIDKSRESSVKILKNFIASQLSSSANDLPDIEFLPSLQSSLIQTSDKKFKIYEELIEMKTNSDLCEDSDESDSESEISVFDKYRDLQNFDSLDMNSEEFNSLPPDIKYEILTELKQKFKGYRNTEIMPKESNDFSKYQLQRLLKKRTLQSKIDDTINELNGNHSEEIIEKLDKKNFCFESESNAGRLLSDETIRYIFMKKSQTSEENKTEHMDNKVMAITEDSASNTKYSQLSDSSRHVIPVSSDSEDSITEPKTNCEHLSQRVILNDLEERDIKLETIGSKTPTNDQIIEDIVKSDSNCNEFTKLKPIELSSDSEDNDFEEVIPQTPESFNKMVCVINDKIPLISEIIEPKDNDIIEVMDSSVENVLQEIDIIVESVKSVESVSEPKASSSQTFECISREELMKTCHEMNKQNRLANKTTDQMMTDCMELLKLFGIPYVMSPMEAEAQCAALELLGLTSGTITDDSDILLFGGQNVYKNFFTSSKYVELFNASDIESRFGLTRTSLICIAMLCGSDYTEGVDGVGAVTATEILSEFRGEGLKPLVELKNWWKSKRDSKDKRPENRVRAKLLKYRFDDPFPNSVIFDAYMSPTVDKSEEKFVWGMPSLEQLRQYARTHFGWTLTKTDEILLPVLKKVNEKQIQMKIEDFFKIQVQPKDTSLVSKRMTKAIDKLRGIESVPQTSGSNISKTTGALKHRVKNQRKTNKRLQTKPVKNNVKSCPKRRVLSKQMPEEIKLSESSEESN